MQSDASAFGPFVLNRQHRALTRMGQPVPVSHRGYILLETLLDAGGEPVSNEAAIALAHKSLATFNHVVFVYITLTAAYANLERMGEARAMLAKVRELGPNLTIKRIEEGRAAEDSFSDAVIPGLRKAGLPES